jgi:hypothetical protein
MEYRFSYHELLLDPEQGLGGLKLWFRAVIPSSTRPVSLGPLDSNNEQTAYLTEWLV